MSHRIIEKRRRDRMNNCLADLSRLIPAEYMKKGRGRVEKTEIIEMAIKHMKYLQSNVSPSGEFCETVSLDGENESSDIPKCHKACTKHFVSFSQVPAAWNQTTGTHGNCKSARGNQRFDFNRGTIQDGIFGVPDGNHAIPSRGTRIFS